MTQSQTRKPLATRCRSYSDSHWEMVKNIARNAGDNYPKDAGTYRIEFLDGYVSVDRRFEMFLNRMTRTRINFKIIAVNESYHRIAVVYSHEGFDESLFVDQVSRPAPASQESASQPGGQEPPPVSLEDLLGPGFFHAPKEKPTSQPVRRKSPAKPSRFVMPPIDFFGEFRTPEEKARRAKEMGEAFRESFWQGVREGMLKNAKKQAEQNKDKGAGGRGHEDKK